MIKNSISVFFKKETQLLWFVTVYQFTKKEKRTLLRVGTYLLFITYCIKKQPQATVMCFCSLEKQIWQPKPFCHIFRFSN